jgi:uncharacterized phage protein gp47/JayE
MGQYNFKSRQQILAGQVAKFLAETPINDLNKGSNVLTFLEANSRELVQQYVKMNSILRNVNLDKTTGQDLDDKAWEFGITRKGALKATGLVNILRDSDFEKVATSLYSGLPEPVQGDQVLHVNDASASEFGTSGTLIIGRGTVTEEEVAYSVAPANNTNYWTFTLDTPLANDHSLDHSVILKQGDDETIVAGTSLLVQPTSNSPAITFTINQTATLLAGEESVDNVGVTCTEFGEVGNIPILAINGSEAFSAEPFSGARAQNVTKFTTGQNREQDDSLRDRIKNHIQSLSRGIKLAIQYAIIGLVDPNTAKRVVSANIVSPTTLNEWVKVYIDDGTGFEPSFNNQGFETLLEDSLDSEVRLQLDNFPLVKAQVEASNLEPYNMSSGALTLEIEVARNSETITFLTSDFLFSNVATAEEIVKAINNKASLVEARTSGSGKGVVISPKTEQNETIQITGGTSVGILGLPTDLKETIYLYDNDRKLSKDGDTAFVDSGEQENYNFSGIGAGPWPLNLTVDGKSANPQTVTFDASDFVDPSAATAEEVIEVINEQLAGAEASLISSATKVRITSNKTKSAKSKLQITGGTANTVLDFPTSEVVGSDKDFTLNRFTGTVEFVTPRAPNSKITAGSQYTRAFLITESPENYAVTIGQTLVFSLDGGADTTVTFPATEALTAAQAASIINAQTKKAIAQVAVIGDLNYLRVSTKTYSEAAGSIEVKSSSTATAFDFELDTEVNNQRPHKAFVVAANSGPFSFTRNQTLVTVLDGDPINKTYSTPMDYPAEVTAATSTTVFRDASLNNIFPTDDSLIDFYAVFLSGDNSTSGTVEEVEDMGGNTFRYIFDALPTNLADFAIGDHFTISGMQEIQNNGSFILTGISAAATGYVEVTNNVGVEENGSSGSATVGQRRAVSDYTASTGEITVSSALRVTPTASDTFILIPSTLANLEMYFNNTKITTLSTKAFIDLVENGTKLQFTSKLEGSDGKIQVTGGRANTLLGFSTSIVNGLQSYSYYTGLSALVSKTIYGSDLEPEEYPGIGAAGIDFEVLSPTVQEAEFVLDVTLAKGFSLPVLEDEIKSSITAYVNTLGIGENVILAEIIDVVMNIEGITDVRIVNLTENIIISEAEIARTRRALIGLG